MNAYARMLAAEEAVLNATASLDDALAAFAAYRDAYDAWIDAVGRGRGRAGLEGGGLMPAPVLPLTRVRLITYSHQPHTTPVHCAGCQKRLHLGTVVNEDARGTWWCDECAIYTSRTEDGARQACCGALETEEERAPDCTVFDVEGR